ncbi:Cysteine desulfurase CsdA [Vibrio stylophorae]|uniref:Probable cysteine desulfurase n=1 Tax=Vibrio stylophorae TaxID=659351 RepID=A0ABM8ZVD0_9VIBR|nr:cysteine desulfurase CsdA [Vibrio stylophorae]CAH0534260.1 Cysteine desulfurase CsdA [Vibrio stylophorae]
MTSFDIDAIRRQFPALCSNTAPVYLDSAATTQKPSAVIGALTAHYQGQTANVHRGLHQSSLQASNRFESARHTLAQFIHASCDQEIIWTRGATEALNLVAQSYGRHVLQTHDVILVSEMEHHANIVPWQLVAQQTGARVEKIPMLQDGRLDLTAYQQLLTQHSVKIVAVTQMSNVTGCINPIEKIAALAHQAGAVIVVDGAQAVAHLAIDVQALDADFYVFSGHKIYGPEGIGILYGKLPLLEQMPPWHGGGKMVTRVSFEGTQFTGVPAKFEAGTPNIGAAIALAAAVDWLEDLDRTQAEAHIHNLVERTKQAIEQNPALSDLRIVAPQPHSPLLSITMDGVHHSDLATLLDQQQIAVRSGHHCAHPLMDALNLSGTVRISFALYNNQHDVDRLLTALAKACDML